MIGRRGTAASLLAAVALLGPGLAACSETVEADSGSGAPATAPVVVTDEDVQALCAAPTATSSPSSLPGPADRLLPPGRTTMVVCRPPVGGFDTGFGRPLIAYVVTDVPRVAAIAAALDAAPQPTDAATSCTTLGGGLFSAVFLGPAGAAVRLILDHVNCVSAETTTTRRVGVQEAVRLIDDTINDPATRQVTLTS